MCKKVDEEITDISEHGKALKVVGYIDEVVGIFETINIKQFHRILASVLVGHISEAHCS
jgi:hypothetical protein